MSIKTLGTLAFILIVTLGGTAAFADGATAAAAPDTPEAAAPAKDAPVVVEPAAAPANDAPVVLENAAELLSGSCSSDLLDTWQPRTHTGCQGGEGGPCDHFQDCRDYFCPLGSFRCCVGGTGSGCDGTCSCCG